MDPEIVEYPFRHRRSRRRRDFPNAPSTLTAVYDEAMAAFGAGLRLLAAAGLRSVVEALCADKGVKQGPVPKYPPTEPPTMQVSKQLDGKIAGLAEQGHMTGSHASALHQLRFLGNDALHRLAPPDIDSLATAFDILEHTIDHVYELQHKEGSLQRSRDRRP